MLLIVSLGMAMAVPSLSDWQEERQLDLAAEELASAIREAETEARSETSRYGNVVRGRTFSVRRTAITSRISQERARRRSARKARFLKTSAEREI